MAAASIMIEKNTDTIAKTKTRSRHGGCSMSECGVVGHGGVLAFAVSMLKFTVRKLTHSSVVGSSDQTSVTMNAP